MPARYTQSYQENVLTESSPRTLTSSNASARAPTRSQEQPRGRRLTGTSAGAAVTQDQHASYSLRNSRIAAAAAIALIFSGFGGAASAQEPTSIVVRGDVQIGRFLVHRDGTLDGAIRAFGKPTSLRRGRYLDCTARWRPIGLRIGFYNLGGRNPCLRQYGYFSNATMVGRHWVTARGLRLGDRHGSSTSFIPRAASPARGHGS
jgi:hypothetical protein